MNIFETKAGYDFIDIVPMELNEIKKSNDKISDAIYELAGILKEHLPSAPKKPDAVEELYNSLSDFEKDFIYRKVWSEHVEDDIREYLENNEVTDKNFNKDDIKDMAKFYVYEGKYDCNLSYWENIENLISYFLL